MDYKIEQYFSLILNQQAVIIHDHFSRHEQAESLDLRSSFSYNLFFSAYFFSWNSIFLSQQISRNSVSACFFSEANKAYMNYCLIISDLLWRCDREGIWPDNNESGDLKTHTGITNAEKSLAAVDLLRRPRQV